MIDVLNGKFQLEILPVPILFNFPPCLTLFFRILIPSGLEITIPVSLSFSEGEQFMLIKGGVIIIIIFVINICDLHIIKCCEF